MTADQPTQVERRFSWQKDHSENGESVTVVYRAGGSIRPGLRLMLDDAFLVFVAVSVVRAGLRLVAEFRAGPVDRESVVGAARSGASAAGCERRASGAGALAERVGFSKPTGRTAGGFGRRPTTEFIRLARFDWSCSASGGGRINSLLFGLAGSPFTEGAIWPSFKPGTI